MQLNTPSSLKLQASFSKVRDSGLWLGQGIFFSKAAGFLGFGLGVSGCASIAPGLEGRLGKLASLVVAAAASR